jgi:hypothetical protein
MPKTTLQRMALLALIAVLAAAALAAPAGAKTNVVVGMGEQHVKVFKQSKYRALKIKQVRYFIRWDAMRVRYAREQADAYIAAAKKAGTKVYLHLSSNDLRYRKAKLPSIKTFNKWVGRLVKHYRALGVRDWGVWNEANHKSQPTYKSPKRAAQYFVAFRKLCKGCTIVALDVLDQPKFLTYVDSFYRALPASQRKYASIVGLHNYGDTNYYRSTSTRAVIAGVRKYNKKATFWMTETGGIVNFGKRLKCNTKRAAKAINYMFKLAKDYRPIKRLYNYNYYGTSCRGFDSGIMTKGGKARAGYYAFKKGAKAFGR